MNLKLKKSNLSKYFHKRVNSLEKMIEKYKQQNETSENTLTRDEIITEVNMILSTLPRKNGQFKFDHNLIRFLEEVNAEILGDGGLQKINPSILLEYLHHMNGLLLSIKWDDENNKDLKKIMLSTYIGVLKKELKQFESQSNHTVVEDPNTKECLMQILNIFVKYSRDLSTVERVLSKYYDIDLRTGKNIDQVPEHIITKAVYSFVKLYYYYSSSQRQSFSGFCDHYYDIIYNYARDIAQKESPERVLLKMPELMEFYNIAHSTVTTENGDIVPSDDIVDKSNQILGLVKPNIPISKEEKAFMESASDKYMSQKMPDYVLKKYVEIYLKMLTNKVTDPNIEENYTEKVADVLLGQYALGNQALMNEKAQSTIEPKKLLHLLVYDYAKITAKKYAPSYDLRITRSSSFDNTGWGGWYAASQKTIALNSQLIDLNEIYFIIGAIFHESMHATENHSLNFNEYNSPIEYSGNKLQTIWEYNPYFVVNGKLNYTEGAHEILSRIEENKKLLEFLKRHGCDKIFSNYCKSIKRKEKLELKRGQNHDSINNPYYHGKAKEAKNYGLVSFKDGFELSISDVFDRFIIQHLNLCQPGSYYSIEYNPDGKRKTASQIITELGNLDESPENDGKRQVYKDIIQNGCIKKEDPKEVLKALSEYKKTNPKNDEIVQSIVQESILKIIKRIETEYYKDSVLALRKKYLLTGTNTSVHIMRTGYSFLEKTSAVIDRITSRYEEERAQAKIDGDKAISPFVRGLMAPAKIEKKPNISIPFGNVMGSLRRHQESFKLSNSLGVTKETVNAYLISVGDIFNMAYGQTISKQIEKVKKQLKPEPKDEQLTLE